MNLETFPAEVTVHKGEINLISTKYFPNEDNRLFTIEVIHGPKYAKVCSSCQLGVKYIKTAFDFMNRAFMVWNTDVIDQTHERVEVLVRGRGYRREFDLTKQRVCILPIEPTLENLANWFVSQFKGQLELSHAKIFNMGCEGESVSISFDH